MGLGQLKPPRERKVRLAQLCDTGAWPLRPRGFRVGWRGPRIAFQDGHLVAVLGDKQRCLQAAERGAEYDDPRHGRFTSSMRWVRQSRLLPHHPLPIHGRRWLVPKRHPRQRFLAALRTGQLQELMEVMAPDVVLTASLDGN
jgi:hypothetical protein